MTRHQRPHRRRSKLGTTFAAGRGKSIRKYFGTVREQDIRTTFKKYQNKTDWKEPAEAFVMTKEEADDVARAYEFFHASRAKIQREEILVKHKDGLVVMPYMGYRVSTPGYYERYGR